MRQRLAWLGEQVDWLLGIVGSLLLMLILLPMALLESENSMANLQTVSLQEKKKQMAHIHGSQSLMTI